MKIAFVVGALHMGGLEKVTIHMVNALSDKYNIDLIVLNQNNNFYDINESVNIIEGNIKYCFLEKVARKVNRIVKSSFVNCYSKEIKYVSSLIEKSNYDRVIAVDGNNAIIVNHVKDKLMDKKNISMITWVHNNYNTYFNTYYRNFQKDLGEALANSEYVVTLTQKDRESYSIHNENTVTIYNPITIKSIEVASLDSKEILFVARLVREHKGLDYLVEIAKKIKDSGWIMRVLGDGPDKQWLEDQIKVNELQRVLYLQGSVKNNIDQYYKQASIFISTSKWEGLPLVMIEAISSGLPVVSFNHSGAVEILDNNKYGMLIEMGNIDEFYKNLNILMESIEQRKKWGEKSLCRSHDFQLTKIKEEWIKILN